MKRLLRWITAVMIGIAAYSPPGWAETAYIVDSIKVSLRSGPGNDQKSVGVAESGLAVDLVKPGEEWSLVRLGNGTEGYVLTRYLTTAQPARFRLEQLLEKNKTLTSQAAGLLEENIRLNAENENLSAAVATGEKELAGLKGEFEVFKKEAADVVALKSRADALAAELEQKKQEIARLESGPLAILENENLYWFLSGAVVLLAGFLTGYVVKRPRRWSTFN
jgi:SH3 domain protein